MRGLIGLVIVVWLVIGVVAAGQRGYFGDDEDIKNCNRTATTAVTIIAGPLNYVGVDPKISCDDVQVPQPSD
jgi:hypothetical protein